METNTLFVIAVITLVFQVIGLGRYKMFLMFAIGGYIALLIEFTSSVSMVIMFIGAILFNAWFATIGSRLD